MIANPALFLRLKELKLGSWALPDQGCVIGDPPNEAILDRLAHNGRGRTADDAPD
jgi:hypothetical protein